MNKTNDMVLGFIFNVHMTHVVLMLKNRPEWQAGLYNGVGGHIEPGETPTIAMVRECREETGLLTCESDWTECLRLCRQGEHPFNVIVFRCICAADDMRREVNTIEDQPVRVRDVQLLRVSGWRGCISNIPWMVELMIDCQPGVCGNYSVSGTIGHRE